MANKTIDGIKLADILRTATEVGATIREGNSHPYILNYGGLRPCPIAKSTHAERMVAPWLAQATGTTKHECYEAMRRGYW
ncbi:hypothetical protein KA107_01905 [Candidatus Pacearchaeota archaeon]|nr:hypothetical protein [Candidatus Pacearchaeota archaeon]